MDLAKLAFKRELEPDSLLRIVSIHWVRMINGHSSPHSRGMGSTRIHILYGTGDVINDYEAFENPGGERFDRLRRIYIVDINATSGELLQLHIVPMFMNRLRLERFTPSSSVWRPYKRYLEKNPREHYKPLRRL